MVDIFTDLISSTITNMGVCSWGRGPPWIFKHGTDKAEGGLMVLFFDLVFFVGPPQENFLPTPLSLSAIKEVFGGTEL